MVVLGPAAAIAAYRTDQLDSTSPAAISEAVLPSVVPSNPDAVVSAHLNRAPIQVAFINVTLTVLDQQPLSAEL